MSRVFLDKCEIALSEADLRHALMLWIERVTFAGRNDYTLESFNLTPGNKYVVRMVVRPPAVAKLADTTRKQGEAVSQST